MTRRGLRRTLLVVANLVGLAAVLSLGAWDVLQVYTGVALPERAGAPMELVAHRGDLERFPENTREAIVAASELPVDGIEFDTIMSADGTWWVIHDPSLARTTDTDGWLPDLSDADVERARIDGGIGFDAVAHDGLAIPRLSDVLDALAGYDGRLYVDVQHAPTGDVADVVALLAGRDAAILCRDLSDSRRVKEMDRGITTFLRVEDGPADDSVDGWLMESFFEADAGAVQGAALPVITFMDQWRAGDDETAVLRRAWAIGVSAFLTKQPSVAIAARDQLIEEPARR